MNFVNEQFPSENFPPSSSAPFNTVEYEQALGLMPVSVSIPEVQEIEDRLGLSKYYKILLENGIFESRDVFSIKVEAEVRQFIIGRLQELLGVKTEKSINSPIQLPFSEEEINLLKILAKKLLVNSVPKLESQEPQLKTVKSIIEVSPLKVAKGNSKSKTTSNPLPPLPIDPVVRSGESIKKKEENELASIVEKKNLPITHAIMSQEVLAARPKMPNSQEMALWAQKQAEAATGGVFSSSTAKLS